MAAAREPLTREQIAAAAGLDAEQELPSILSRLASFVPVSNGRYAFFHKSFSDWLTGWDIRRTNPLQDRTTFDLRKGWIRLANWCWPNTGGVPVTFLHIVSDIFQLICTSRSRPRFVDCARDFNFLQSKLKATDASALIADYEYLPEEADLRLVQSAIRLSAHVLARDHHQLAGQLTGRLLGESFTQHSRFATGYC